MLNKKCGRYFVEWIWFLRINEYGQLDKENDIMNENSFDLSRQTQNKIKRFS